MKELLKSGEDYLEAIYQLEEEHGKVKSVDVARQLCVSKPSASRAFSRLEEQGYIKKESYGDIFITNKGREMAKYVLKKHVALKKLLTVLLGVSEETAEKDACKIEHALSLETAERLFEFLQMS